MLKHTKKIKEIYDDIQKELFYMIPEKWSKLYLYASVVDRKDEKKSGELFFYYIPKGIIRKNPINVYEIPQKFNLEEEEYTLLVNSLYKKIEDLREEFKKVEVKKTWSNVTMIIDGMNFKAEYNYEDLNSSPFSSYERHIIWRYKYLGIGLEQLNKKEREIIQRYLNGSQTIVRAEKYEAGVCIKNIKNIVDYETNIYEDEDYYIEEVEEQSEPQKRSQILFPNGKVEKK